MVIENNLEEVIEEEVEIGDTMSKKSSMIEEEDFREEEVDFREEEEEEITIEKYLMLLCHETDYIFEISGNLSLN